MHVKFVLCWFLCVSIPFILVSLHKRTVRNVIVSLKRKYVPFAAVVLLSLKRKVNEVNSGT